MAQPAASPVVREERPSAFVSRFSLVLRECREGLTRGVRAEPLPDRLHRASASPGGLKSRPAK